MGFWTKITRASSCHRRPLQVPSIINDCQKFTQHMVQNLVFRQSSQLVELLENCDYICNLLPSTPDTKYLLSEQVLSRCKKVIQLGLGLLPTRQNERITNNSV